MKQLLILSGKGGTGKTTIASAFIKLAEAKVYADCDVDAPNLDIALNVYESPTVTPFYGMDKANIDTELCSKCGLCIEHCRFSAITYDTEYIVDAASCEGCGMCELVCPSGAVSLKPNIAGNLNLYNKDRIFSSAELKMGNGNSGLLVTEVKKQMKTAEKVAEVAIIDGSPGIGCPVIASITGVDMVLIVSEPTLSGISDLVRIIKTARGLQTDIMVCINKYDINLENSDKIDEICLKYNIPSPCRIAFDKRAITALNDGKTVIEIDCKMAEEVRSVYSMVMTRLNIKGVI